MSEETAPVIKSGPELVDPMVAMLERHKARVAAMTPEQRQAEEERRLQSERDNHRGKVEQLRYGWNAPPRHAKRSAEMDGPWGEKFSRVKELMGRSGGVMVALVGGRGSGKTQMAVEIMRQRTEALKSAYFSSATEFFIKIKGTYNRDASDTEAGVLADFSRYSLLVIDEVGKRGGSDWENNLLFEMLNSRYNYLRDTILIDNRTKAEFIETIGPSLASRMNEGGGIIECNWDSFRTT